MSVNGINVMHFEFVGFFCEKKSFTQYSNQRFLKSIVPDFESVILKKEEKLVLFSYFPKGKESKLKLLYRGSRDGFGVSDFNNKYEKQGPTVTKNKNEKNQVFNGFTTQSWSSSNEWKRDSEAFLYFLRSSNTKQKPQKWAIKAGCEENAIYGSSSHGPRFGGGADLILHNNCNSNNSNKRSYNNPSSYNGPTSNDVLAGESYFLVRDYEVYQVQ